MKKRVIIAVAALVIGVLLLAFSVWTENEAKKDDKAKEIATMLDVQLTPEYAGKLPKAVELLAARELTPAEESELLAAAAEKAAKATKKAEDAAAKAAQEAEAAQVAADEAAAAVQSADENADLDALTALAAEKAAEAEALASTAAEKDAAVEAAKAAESEPIVLTDKEKEKKVQDRQVAQIKDLLDVKLSSKQMKAAAELTGEELKDSRAWLTLYSMYFAFHGLGFACIVAGLALLLPGRARVGAGVVAVALGVAVMAGSLVIARTVQDKSLQNLATKTVKLEALTRENTRTLLDVLDLVYAEDMTVEEKVEKATELTGEKYATSKGQSALLAGVEKQLPGGVSAKLRMSLLLHPIDQHMNVDGLVLVLGGLLMVAFGGRQKKHRAQQA